jgi:hypothetical protein
MSNQAHNSYSHGFPKSAYVRMGLSGYPSFPIRWVSQERTLMSDQAHNYYSHGFPKSAYVHMGLSGYPSFPIRWVSQERKNASQ